jgi:Domain of unknown function (DUF1877)
MASRGVHFALTPEQEKALLGARGNDEGIIEIVQEEIEEEWDEEWLCETDKAWDAIHRCLTDGKLELDNGAPPLSLAVLGGEQLYGEGDYYVCFVSREQVPAVARGLNEFARETFDRAYDALASTDYDGPIDSDDREYTWENLQALKELFAKASSSGRSVVFTVDQ